MLKKRCEIDCMNLRISTCVFTLHTAQDTAQNGNHVIIPGKPYWLVDSPTRSHLLYLFLDAYISLLTVQW